MEVAAKKKLKAFMNNYFTTEIYEAMGIIKPNAKSIPYVKAAKRICTFFGYKEIYEYAKHDFLNTRKVDRTNPMNWSKLQVPDKIEMISQSKYLN